MLKKNKKVALAAINPLIKNLLLSISGQCKKLEKNGLLFETVDDAYSMIQK